MQDVDSGKETCTLFEKKLTLFSRYLSATEKMKTVLGENQASELARLIIQRQGLIHKIDKTDLAMKQAFSVRPDKHHYISNKFNGLIAGYLKKLKGIMEKIEPLDRELTVLVEQEGQGTKADLLKKQKVRQAVKGYGSFKTYPAKFLDTHR